MPTAKIKQYYGPDYELDVRASNMENANSKEYLEKIKVQVIENLKKTAHAPSVQLTDVPRTTLAMGDLSDYEDELDDLDEDLNPDERVTMRMLDQRIARDDELYDSDGEEEAVNGVRSHPGTNKRRNIMDYQNPNSVADDIEVDTKVAVSELENGHDEKVPEPSVEAKDEVSDTVMDENEQNATGPEAGDDEPSAAPAVDNEGDVNMEQAAPEPPLQVPTPTSQANSPPPTTHTATAPAPATAEATPLSQYPIEAKQEGEEERQDADITGEESTEIAQQSQS
jgi:histone deacetylase 1/2